METVYGYIGVRIVEGVNEMNVDVEQITDTWRLFTLTNDHGMCVRVLNYGGIIVGMDVPDKNGMIENVVLGYENVTDYADNPTFFGAIVGRVAGRIQDASFSIGEDTYRLEANEGPHHLHGGAAGFHQVVWEDEPFQSDDAVGVKLTHTSVEAKLSYPGNVTVSVT